MGQVNFGTVDNAFHTYFLPNRVERIGYEEQPTLEMLSKAENFYGRAAAGLQFDVAYEAPAGLSFDFSTALANAGTGQYATFTVRRSRCYQIINLDNETMEGSADDSGAFVDLKKEEVETGLKATTERLGQGLFRNHGAAIGRANGLSGSVVTLTNPDDIVNFRRNMKVQTATTDGTTGAVRAGQTTVVSVDRSAGKVTLAATFAVDIPGITLTAGGDWIFPAGDFGLGIYGFDSYIPATAPTAGDAVFVFDRSVDTRLSGIRYDGSKLNISDAIMKGVAQGRREAGSGAFDFAILNYDRLIDFSLDLGAKVQRKDEGGANVGYDTIRVSAGGRPFTVGADHNCQPDICWVLTKRVWIWKSLGKTPRFFTQASGTNFIVDPTADGVQVRCGWRGNLLCLAPGLNERISLGTS